MNARLYDRLAALIGLLLLTILAGLTYYLAEIASREQKTVPFDKTKHEPDYFMSNFTLIKLNKDGKPAFRLLAENMQHYPDDDTNDFIKPSLVTLDASKPKVTITSERGKSRNRGDIIELDEKVVIIRAASRDNAQLSVRTEYLNIDTNNEFATTGLPVQITQGQSQISGVGMDFDNLRSAIALHANVKSTWVAESKVKN